MTALKQALNSARPRGGVIDEGNSIYLFDIGVNVSHAQAEIFNYLKIENEMISKGQAPSHEMTVEWTRRSVQTSSKIVQKDLQQVVDSQYLMRNH